ncbi:hypothetical protein MHU86_14154 [Fragilaria crotonensis]|nr:hypothetical protein MHU86_14154 [Fragilaria crotonensis]
MSIGVEAGEYGNEEFYFWVENKYGTKLWDCEWKCSTTRDATNEKFDCSGDGGDKSTKPRGSGSPACRGDRAMMHATLMPTPRSLHDLWQEYEFGVGGRKAAKLFSCTERGRSKHKYHRRKVVWDLISGLVRQGHTADLGIDRIYAVYGGQTSVSNIINGLKRDKKMAR